MKSRDAFIGRSADLFDAWRIPMGLVKTRRLAAMQKQQKAKAGMKPPMPKDKLKFENRRRKP